MQVQDQNGQALWFLAGGPNRRSSGTAGFYNLKPVRTSVAIFGSLGVCIYVPASRHWLISYSPVHLT